MTTNHLKMAVEPIAEMSYISSIPQTVDNIQHSVPTEVYTVTTVFQRSC